MHLLIIFGIILILGLAAGRLFEKIGIPQVVGTIIIGVILGDSVTGLVHTKLRFCIFIRYWCSAPVQWNCFLPWIFVDTF